MKSFIYVFDENIVEGIKNGMSNYGFELSNTDALYIIDKLKVYDYELLMRMYALPTQMFKEMHEWVEIKTQENAIEYNKNKEIKK